MLFSELNFWAFFVVVFAAYALLPHRLQNRLLLVASYFFYAAWDWRFLSLILLSTTVDYFVGQRLHAVQSDQRRRGLLLISLCVNLGLLFSFKYLGFFVDSFREMLLVIGYEADPVMLSIVLPVGISFYTFQTLSYTIDIYRRKIGPTEDFLDFALFVAFFPQLVAGPIERASNLLPNITGPRSITAEGIGRGVVLCLLGLVKKVVVADGVAPTVDAVYAAPDPTGAEIMIATWLFAIQIYGDFSGYSDIARGVSKILGFNLMQNFAQPYFAANPQEFWRRWHISLSTWLRDYLYVSLGGNRGGRWATYRNLMGTMLLGGLWHGAGWNFILWGAYQGGLLVAHRALFGRQAGAPPSHRRPLHWLGRLLMILTFFQVVCIGWMLFRATSLDQIVTFAQRLVTITPEQFAALAMPAPPFPAYCGIALVLAWDLMAEATGSQRPYLRFPLLLRAPIYAGLAYLLAFGATTQTTAFIYFQF